MSSIGLRIADASRMRWPKHPAESVHPSRFHPPFCPRPECPSHRGRPKGFARWGSYRKPSDIARSPRVRCKDCTTTCSRQTFSCTYYLKRPPLMVAVASGLAACSAHRQIARSERCAKTTVTRMAERLGRHAILFHAGCLESLQTIGEPIVHDHFETFIGRQDHALGIGTAVGANSWFVYDIDPAPHRGSGRRPDRKESASVRGNRPYIESIRRTIDGLLPKVFVPNRLELKADGRKDYQLVARQRELRDRIDLQAYPNPKRGPKGSPRSAESLARDWA